MRNRDIRTLMVLSYNTSDCALLQAVRIDIGNLINFISYAILIPRCM